MPSGFSFVRISCSIIQLFRDYFHLEAMAPGTPWVYTQHIRLYTSKSNTPANDSASDDTVYEKRTENEFLDSDLSDVGWQLGNNKTLLSVDEY